MEIQVFLCYWNMLEKFSRIEKSDKNAMSKTHKNEGNFIYKNLRS